MKLISLNVWGGRAYPELIKFLKTEKNKTDIFCFQEVLDYTRGEPGEDAKEAKRMHQGERFSEVPDLYPEIEDTLVEFDGFLSEPYSSGMERLATFVRKGTEVRVDVLPIHKPFSVDVHGKPYNVSCIMQHINIENDDKTYDLSNTHGLWQQSDKKDTPERIEQSREILRIFSKFGDTRILCGDLNLLPDTEAVKMLEKDMRNLIKEYNITNTRGSLYTKKIRYADYVFVSEKIRINNFNVLDVAVSDHLPLLLEFS